MRHALAIASLCLSAVLGFFYCVPLHFTATIDSRELREWGGRAFAIDLAAHLPEGLAARLLSIEADSNRNNNASKLELLEDGRPVGPSHSIHAEISGLGGGRYSHWENALIFSSSDGSDPRTNGRKYTIVHPMSPAPLIPIALVAIGLLAARRSTAAPLSDAHGARGVASGIWSMASRHGTLLFWIGVAVTTAFANWTFLALLPAPAVYPDSNGYLTWSLARTIGYPALLAAYEAMAHRWELLPVVQLNLVLAGTAALAWAVAAVTASRLLGWFVFAFTVAAGSILLSAADMLTEAPFSAFVMLHLAAFMLYLHHGTNRHAAAAGALLAVAVLVKSVAVVLVGPLLLFVLFRAGFRRVTSALVLAPALAAWFAPSLHNAVRHGFFEGSVIGGYALAGHVAWAIRPVEGHPDAPVASRIAARIHPELAKRPPAWASVDDYVDYTAREYNTLLWANMVPEAWDALGKACTPDKRGTCLWMRCPDDCELAVNRMLMRLARQAILDDPWAYGRHVAAHHYGLWRDAFSYAFNFVPGTRGRADWLHDAYDPALTGYRARLGPLPPFPTRQAALAIEATIEQSPWRRLVDLVTLRQPLEWLAGLMSRHAAAVVLFSIGLCSLVFRSRSLPPAALASCYGALIANAYFLGTALAQPSLHRYAWAMQGVIAASFVLAAYCAAGLMKRRLPPAASSRATGFDRKEPS